MEGVLGILDESTCAATTASFKSCQVHAMKLRESRVGLEHCLAFVVDVGNALTCLERRLNRGSTASRGELPNDAGGPDVAKV
jgi:hypothetical protein